MRTLSNYIEESREQGQANITESSIFSGKFKTTINDLIEHLNDYRNFAKEAGANIEGDLGDLLDGILEQAQAVLKNSSASRQLDKDSFEFFESMIDDTTGLLNEFLEGNVDEGEAVAGLESMVGFLSSLVEGTFNAEDWGI